MSSHVMLMNVCSLWLWIMVGRIHSTESFGTVDGPGIRFVIFLQGCDMRCRYCHNPDTWKMTGGTEASADELLDKAERYRSYWGDDGGITVSGGEPLLQIDFLLELFRKAKQRNITTCLDTSAQPFSLSSPFIDKFRELMTLTDTVLLDVKHIDDKVHRQLTGHSNENILQCVRLLDELHKHVWIRHVLVPGITDDDIDLHRLRAFLDTLSCVDRVDVLPYHTLGVFKWQSLGIKYTLDDVRPPSADRVKNAENILKG